MHDQARCLIVHTPRVVIWTTSDLASTRTALAKAGARPRLLVPVPHGTFVLGPNPCTSESLIDTLHVVKGMRVGLMWTETTAWLVCLGGGVRGWRFGPDDSFELQPPKRLPDGLGWLADAVEAVRSHGVIDGLGALRVALESVGFPLDFAALVRIDAGEVDDAVPHHRKRWWERVVGERSGLAHAGPVSPALMVPGLLITALAIGFFLFWQGIPDATLIPLIVLPAVCVVVGTPQYSVLWSRGNRADPFPERDVLGMSEWARAADEE